MSASVGGAIQITDSSFEVQFSFNIFEDCNSTSFRRTTSRQEDNPSGGACHFDISTINLSNIYTTHCHTNFYGHSIYCSIPQGKKYYFDCLADSYSGREAAPYSSILGCDKGYPVFRNINITYPQHSNYAGTILFGLHPISISYKYSHIVFNKESEYRSTAIGFSIHDAESVNDAQYLHVQNGIGQSEKGIFTLWRGHHNFNFLCIVDCSGVFNYNLEAAESITIQNSYLDHNLQLNNVQTESPFNDINSFSSIVFPLCDYPINGIASCLHNNKFKLTLFLNALFTLSFTRTC